MREMKQFYQRSIWMVVGVLSASDLASADGFADLTTDPGATVTVTVTISLDTVFGGGVDTDSDSAAATGTATAILTPTEPPWDEVTVKSMSVSIEALSFHFNFGFLLDLDVNISNLQLDAVEPFGGPLDPDGGVFFPSAMFHISGTAHVVGLFGLINEDLAIDNIGESEFSGRFTGGSGTVVFDELFLDPLSDEIDPSDLPDGVNSLSFTINVDMGGVVFSGPYTPILEHFDHDGDGDIDLLDYADFVACTTGPGIDVFPPCDVHDADEDGDVDHHDFAEFQVAYGAQ